MALTQVYSANVGDTITAARWNNEFGNILNNGTDVGFPLTKAVSFAGYTITWDAAGVTTVISSASQAFQITPGAKTGTPTTTGGFLNFVAATYTDNNTAGSGTATAWVGWAIQRPTLAATNASVVTTDAATLYIANDVAAGTNETLTRTWAVWVDAGACRFDGNMGGIGFPAVQELRLTLTTALPVTTADVTAAGTIYLTPYTGSHISLYDGAQWITYSTAEISLALTATSGKPYDVWCYASAGVPTLETTVWSNDTARVTALAYQNGVLIKSGTATRRYIGSFYASGANTTEDSGVKRWLFNYYNRVPRPMKRVETTDSWTYTTATMRQANGATANQLDFMIGVDEVGVSAQLTAVVANSVIGTNTVTAIGLDSTTSGSGLWAAESSNVAGSQYPLTAFYAGLPGAGRHYLSWNEYSAAAGTTTWQGDNGGLLVQSGLVGLTWG